MSKTVDERVVEMKFDNKEFENNVKTSMSTLDKLKSALKLDGASKGFEELNKSAKSVDLNPISKSIETVQVKFSALEVMAVTALANITNSAINFGKQMVDAFAISPIREGFSEYELLMDSVKTIKASTGEEVKDINKYLDELNRYADKTIYTFSDMTQNIGKFTNSGVKLDAAVKAIQGISNEAAVSGANANEASRAMYNFAQALSAGYVKLIDWKSIENANMATMEFKQQLLDTAVAMGTVVKEGEEYRTVTTNNKGKVSELFTATKGFNDALQHQWMTSEVLVQTLENYSTNVDEMTDAEKTAWKEKLRGIGYTEEQIKGLEDLSKKAFDAATKITKFTQLIDVVKEAIGSGWAQSFRLIFGDFEEAQELWTGVGNVITGYVDKVSNARNATLTLWSHLGGRDAAIQAAKNIFEGFISVIKPIKEAFTDIFPPVTADRLIQISKGLADFTANLKLSEEGAQNVKAAFTGVFSVIKMFGDAIGTVARVAGPILYSVFNGLFGVFLKFSGFIGNVVSGFNAFVSGTRDSSGELTRLDSIVGNISTGIHNLFDAIAKLKVSFAGLVTESQKARAAAAFSKILDNIGNALEKLSKKFSNIKWLDGLQKKMNDATGTFSKFGNGVVEFLVSGLEKLANADFSFNKKIEETDNSFSNFTGTVTTGADSIIQKIQEIASAFRNALVPTDDIVKNASERFKEISGSMTTGLDGQGMFDKVIKGIKTALFGVLIFEFTKGLNEYLEIKEKLAHGLTGLMKSIKGFFKALTTDIKINTVRKTIKDISISIALLVGSVYALSTIDPNDLDRSLKALGALGAGLAGFMASMQVLSMDKFGANAGVIKSMGLALIGVAAALVILAPVIKQFEGMTKEDAFTGIGAVLGSMLALCGALKTMAKESVKFNGMGPELLAMSVSLLAIAEAIKILSKPVMNLSYIDSKNLARGLISVGALMAGLTKALSYLVNSTYRIEGAAGRMVAVGAAMMGIASAMLILSVPVKVIGDMRWQDAAQGIVAVSVGMVAMAAALKIAAGDFKGISSSAGKMVAAGAAMMGIAAAMTILMVPIKVLGEMDLPNLAQGLGAVVVGIGAMSLALDSIAGNGAGNSLAAGAAIMMIATALTLLIVPITALGALPLPVIAQGLSAFLGAMVGFAVVGLIAQNCSAGLLALGGSLMMISGAILIAGVGVTALGVGFAAMAAGLTALSAISETAAKSIVTAITTIVSGLLTMVLRLKTDLIAAASTLISVACQAIITNAPLIADALTTVVVSALAALASALPALVEAKFVIVDAILGILVKHTPQIVDKAITWIIQILNGIEQKVPSLFSAIGSLVTTIVKTIMDGINGLSASSLSGVMEFADRLAKFFIMLAGLAVLAAPATIGVLAFGGLVTQLTAVLAVVGAINKIPGLKDFVDSGGTLLQSVGTAIGNFLGGFVGGALDGISASLPSIGSNLSAFMTNAMPFIEGAKDLGPEMLDGVNALVATIVALTGASVLNGLSLFAGGAIGFVAFGAELQAFGPMVSDFAEKIKNINAAKVQAAASVGSMIVELTKAMPKSGGLQEAIFGKSTDMEKFGEQLVSFGESIASFSEKVDGKVKATAVEAAKNAGSIMVEFANTLPNSGGVAGFFAGENDIDTFGTQLVSFGESLASFSEKVDGKIKETAVEAAKYAGDMMLNLANSIPNTGGLVSFFTGDNTMQKFGEQLVYFGFYMAAFSEKITGIDVSAVEATATAGKCMTELANSIPKTGGLGAIFGDAGIDTFGQKLCEFGDAFKTFSQSVAGIVYEDVYNAVACVRQLVHLGEDMSTFDTSVYSNFASGLKLMANNAIQSFCDAFNMCTDRVQAAVNVLFSTAANLVNVQSITLHDAGYNAGNQTDMGISEGIQALQGQVMATIQTTCNMVLSQFRALLPKIQFNTIAQNQIMQGLIDGMKSKVQALLYTIKTICTDIISKFDHELPKKDFVTFGKRCIEGIIDGLKDSSMKATLNSTIIQICNDIKSAFDKFDMRGKMKEVGINAMQGFIDGINEKGKDVSPTITKIVNDAVEAAKKALQEKSPSKVFYGIGKYVSQGLAIGISDYGKEVSGATTNMAHNAVDAMKEAIGKISDIIGSDMDVQPTITPIVDLTNIQNGSKKIKGMLTRGLNVSMSYGNALAASGSQNYSNGSAGSNMRSSTVSNNYNFTQNNYSPKALSQKEIYRQTRNQFSQLKGMVSGT